MMVVLFLTLAALGCMLPVATLLSVLNDGWSQHSWKARAAFVVFLGSNMILVAIGSWLGIKYLIL